MEEQPLATIANEAFESPNISDLINGSIFDDTTLLTGFVKHYKNESKENLLAMIQDKTIDDDIKIAAAVRAFREEYALEIFSRLVLWYPKSFWVSSMF
jgi:hypothetical protein